MANWDDLRQKFTNDQQAVKTSTERAVQAQRLVEANQASIWNTLRNEAKNAIAKINSESAMLFLREPETGTANEFTILYNRGGESRSTHAVFNPTAHSVAITTSNATKPYLSKVEMKFAVSNQGEVNLCLGSAPQTAEHIVEEMIKNLL